MQDTSDSLHACKPISGSCKLGCCSCNGKRNQSALYQSQMKRMHCNSQSLLPQLTTQRERSEQVGIAVIPSFAAEISSNLATSCQVRHLVNITHFALAFPRQCRFVCPSGSRGEDGPPPIPDHLCSSLCWRALVQSWPPPPSHWKRSKDDSKSVNCEVFRAYYLGIRAATFQISSKKREWRLGLLCPKGIFTCSKG